jgi:RES domain-containing protein
MRVWRICSERHAATAFSGEGSRITSGRWNSEGVPVAYASEHLSLAALELFIHIDDEDEPKDLVAVEAEIAISAEVVARQKAEIVKRLEPSWRFNLTATRARGNEWFAAQHSLVMLVPSVVIEVEWNVLINPIHADFAKMKIVQQQSFRFDERMFKTRGF